MRNHLHHVCLRIHGRSHPVLKNHLHSTLSTPTHRVPWIARLNGPEPSRHRWWQTPRLKWGLDTNMWKKTCAKFKLLLDFCGVMVGGFARFYLLCTKLPGDITPEQPEIHWMIQAQNWWLFWDSVINFGMNQASTTLLWTFTTNWSLKSLVQPRPFSPVYEMLALCFQKETVQPEKPT